MTTQPFENNQISSEAAKSSVRKGRCIVKVAPWPKVLSIVRRPPWRLRTCLTRAQGIKNLSVFLNLIIIAITCLHSTANGVSAQGLASNLGASLHESERAARVRARPDPSQAAWGHRCVDLPHRPDAKRAADAIPPRYQRPRRQDRRPEIAGSRRRARSAGRRRLRHQAGAGVAPVEVPLRSRSVRFAQRPRDQPNHVAVGYAGGAPVHLPSWFRRLSWSRPPW